MGSWAGRLVALGAALAFLGGGWWLQRRPGLDGLRTHLQGDSVPSALLDYGALGGILRENDLVAAVPNPGTRFPAGDLGPEREEPLVFRRKSRPGADLYRANPDRTPRGPSARLPGGGRDHGDWTVLSIGILPEDLEGEERGLLSRPEERIERRASVAVYRGGELLFETRAGLKLHGGASRSPDNPNSYRLHFRDRYGATALPPGLVFEGAIDPVSTLVVRRTRDFASAIAYGIGARLGSRVPRTEAALLYLNGRPQGCYFLTEHLSRRQVAGRLGHEAFYLYRRRGTASGSLEAIRRLRAWAMELAGRARASEVERYVDLEGLIPYWTTVAFCGTQDWEQGAAFLNLADPEARWTWTHWDLDRSFQGDPADRVAFGLFIDDFRESHTSVPSILAKVLLADDPVFRTRFVGFVRDSVNHRLTPGFLEELHGHFTALAVESGAGRGRMGGSLRFLLGRRHPLLEDLRARFGLPPVVELTVRSPGDRPARIEVDGHAHVTPWQGWYFAGDRVGLRVADGESDSYAGWIVGGERYPLPALELVVEGPTVVVPAGRD